MFDSLRARIPAEGRLPLTENFRSQPEILNFVNAVFSPALAQYEPLIPHRRQLSPTPSIEFLFARPPVDEEDADRAENCRRREAEWMARRIDELLDDPTPRIPEKDALTGQHSLRPVRAGDIAVLFRALSDVAIYEDVFRRQGLDYYLVGGREFFAQQEVYDLVNLCAFLNDPDDAVSLLGILRSPFFSLSDDTLLALGGFGQALRESLDAPPPPWLPETQQEQVRHAARVLKELAEKKDRLALAALIELAVERTGYDASLLHEFLGRRKVANLRKLIEMAREFDCSGAGAGAGLRTIADFSQRLRDSISEETVEDLAATHPEVSDVIRLMTIHQSKGLEFPVVIVADLDRSSRGPARQAVYHPDFGPLLPLPPFGPESLRHIALDMHRHIEDREDNEESLRVLYVAMTRAADHLILSSGLQGDGRPRSNWLKLLAARFDLQTGLPKGDPYLGTTPAPQGSVIRPIPQIRVHHEPPGRSVVRPFKKKSLPLARFREIVESGEKDPLTPLLQPVPAHSAVRRQYSVSQIEQADASLRGRGGTTLAAIEWFDATEPTDTDDPSHFGTVLHRVIEYLPIGESPSRKVSKDESRRAVDAIVKAALPLCGISPTEARGLSVETLTRRAQAFLDSDLWTELTGARRSFREIDFLLPWPLDADPGQEQAIIAGQIDCLLETSDGAWKLVDYKTGRVPKGDPAALFDHFSIQLVLYAQAVASMIGRRPDSIEIVALHDEIRRLPLVLWPESVESVMRRIDAALRFLAGGQSATTLQKVIGDLIASAGDG